MAAPVSGWDMPMGLFEGDHLYFGALGYINIIDAFLYDCQMFLWAAANEKRCNDIEIVNLDAFRIIYSNLPQATKVEDPASYMEHRITADLEAIASQFRPTVTFKTRAEYVEEGCDHELDTSTLEEWRKEARELKRTAATKAVAAALFTSEESQA